MKRKLRVYPAVFRAFVHHTIKPAALIYHKRISAVKCIAMIPETVFKDVLDSDMNAVKTLLDIICQARCHRIMPHAKSSGQYQNIHKTPPHLSFSDFIVPEKSEK